MTKCEFELDYSVPGVCKAVKPGLVVTVVGEDGSVFHRRAIKWLPSGVAEKVSMLVARLGDVSVYFMGNEVVVTREELYP